MFLASAFFVETKGPHGRVIQALIGAWGVWALVEVV
jgi:hypothetical protein